MLTYEQQQLLKNVAKKILVLYVIVGILVYLTYACDMDFLIIQKKLPLSETAYPDGIVQTEQSPQQLPYAKKLNLEMIGTIRATGKLYGANADTLISSCPFQRNRVALYNQYFSGIMLSVNGKNISYAVMPQTRLVRQLLSKLNRDRNFLIEHLQHPITIEGQVLKANNYPEISYPHVLVNRIILDGYIYQ